MYHIGAVPAVSAHPRAMLQTGPLPEKLAKGFSGDNDGKECDSHSHQGASLSFILSKVWQ